MHSNRAKVLAYAHTIVRYDRKSFGMQDIEKVHRDRFIATFKLACGTACMHGTCMVFLSHVQCPVTTLPTYEKALSSKR